MSDKPPISRKLLMLPEFPQGGNRNLLLWQIGRLSGGYLWNRTSLTASAMHVINSGFPPTCARRSVSPVTRAKRVFSCGALKSYEATYRGAYVKRIVPGMSICGKSLGANARHVSLVS